MTDERAPTGHEARQERADETPAGRTAHEHTGHPAGRHSGETADGHAVRTAADHTGDHTGGHDDGHTGDHDVGTADEDIVRAGGGSAGGGPSDDLVRAAGGVVWRRAPGRGVEVLLVHRPKYDDWSLPKGKLVPGEGDAEGALREVAEETGLRCSLGKELPTSRYRDSAGRPKVVRYWAMQPADGRFKENREVDEARWVPLGDAAELLSYGRDREVLAALDS